MNENTDEAEMPSSPKTWGIWRAEEGAQRRDVLVKLGKESLILTDKNGIALAHWSLAAIARVNPGGMPARYHPKGNPEEELELDGDAIAVIERLDTLREIYQKRKRRGGFLRIIFFGALLGSVLYLGIIWFPDAIAAHVAKILPDVARRELSDQMLQGVERLTGARCTNIEGQQGIDALQNRLGLKGRDVTVLPDGFDTVLALPGGGFVISNQLLARVSDSDILAGYLLVARLNADASLPMAHLLKSVGPLESLSVLVKGHLSRDARNQAALRLLKEGDPPTPAPYMLKAFENAHLRFAPYLEDYAALMGLSQNDPLLLALAKAETLSAARSAPALLDGDWLRLQTICAR